MRFRASVSLESDLMPVRTHRVELIAPTAKNASRRALDATLKAFKGARWRSVCIVLEKLDEKEASEAA